MQTFDLVPQNKGSFYNKAKVTISKDIATLTSYNTKVASYNLKTKVMQVNDYYSPTTMRHINAFLSYYGFNTCSKAELTKQYLTKN